MVKLEGRIVSKSIDKYGVIYSSIEIPNPEFSNPLCQSLTRFSIKGNYELGEIVEVEIRGVERH